MTELYEKDDGVRRLTSLIPNKVMNSFYRYSHYDTYRDLFQDYSRDSENTKWAPGDFICKVTGMDKDRRLKMIQYVLSSCVDKACKLLSSDADFNRA